ISCRAGVCLAGRSGRCYSESASRPEPRVPPPMPRPLRALVVLALAAAPAFSAPLSPLTPEWKFDVLTLKKGPVHKGLLLEDGPAGVRFKIIRRVPGRPTVWLTVAFQREDVAKLEKLSDEERAALKV